MFDNNLEYLLTRPGGMKVATVIIGLVASILSSHSYSDSPYTHYFEDVVAPSNDTLGLPGTELEVSNMTLTFIILGISVIYLAIHSIFDDICESRLNKFIDTAFHMTGGLFLFAGATILISSAVDVKNDGCPTFMKYVGHLGHTVKHTPPLANVFSMFRTTEEDTTCQLFGEKVIASILNYVNAVLYAVLGFVIFTAKVEEII